MFTEYIKTENGADVFRVDITRDVIEICDKVRSLGYKGEEAEEALDRKFCLLFDGMKVDGRVIDKLVRVGMRRILDNDSEYSIN